MKYLIGVDIGTTGTKTAIFNLDGVELAQSSMASTLIYPQEGWVEQDPQNFIDTTVNTIRKVMEKSKVNPEDVLSIAVAAQMAGTLGINKDFEPVTHYDSWLDSRCEKYVNYIKEKAGDKVIKSSGLPTMIAHCGKILWWKNERPETYAKIEKFIMPTTFVVGKLANLKSKDAFIDDTHVHFSGLYDFNNEGWSDELTSIFDVDKNKLPKVVKPWDIMGTLSAEMAKDCGLVEGTPIAAGCGDQAAGFLGAGVVEKGEVIDVAGTASVFATCVDRYSYDSKNKTLLFCKAATEGLWFPHAFISGGGLCLKWFKENIAKSTDKNFFKKINQEVEGLERGPQPSFFSPYLSGKNFPFNGNVRGFWTGFSWNEDTLNLYKAIMESIGYEYYNYLKIEKELFPNLKLKRVRVIGGGAKSRVFNQIKADILGVPYVTIDREEVGCLGAAMIGGYGVGAIKDLTKAAQKFTKIKEVIEPDMEVHKRYTKYAELYLDLNKDVENFYSKLSELQKEGK